jgi:hypothetical protein
MRYHASWLPAAAAQARLQTPARSSPAGRLRGADRAAPSRQARGAGGSSAVGALAIPGRTFPVRDLYLEDALEATGFAIGRASRRAALGRGCAGPSARERGSAQPAGLPSQAHGRGAVRLHVDEQTLSLPRRPATADMPTRSVSRAWGVRPAGMRARGPPPHSRTQQRRPAALRLPMRRRCAPAQHCFTRSPLCTPVWLLAPVAHAPRASRHSAKPGTWADEPAPCTALRPRPPRRAPCQPRAHAQAPAALEDWEAADDGARQAPEVWPEGGAGAAAAAAGAADYSEVTRRSLAVVDEAVLNFDLLDALVSRIVADDDGRGADAAPQARAFAGLQEVHTATSAAAPARPVAQSCNARRAAALEHACHAHGCARQAARAGRTRRPGRVLTLMPELARGRSPGRRAAAARSWCSCRARQRSGAPRGSCQARPRCGARPAASGCASCRCTARCRLRSRRARRPPAGQSTPPCPPCQRTCPGVCALRARARPALRAGLAGGAARRARARPGRPWRPAGRSRGRVARRPRCLSAWTAARARSCWPPTWRRRPSPSTM